MIYPRLKLKSEVFSNILDGKQTDFNFQNENTPQIPSDLTDEEMQKALEKEKKLIEKSLGQEDTAKFQQTNISDFFFGFGQSSKLSAVSTNVGDES